MKLLAAGGLIFIAACGFTASYRARTRLAR
jgi:hypothetical protein